MFGQAKDRKRLMMKLSRETKSKGFAMWDLLKDFPDEDWISYYLHNAGPLAEALLAIEMGHKPELITVPVSISR